MDSLGDHHTDRGTRGACYPSPENYNGGWNNGDHRNIPDDQLSNCPYGDSAVGFSVRWNALADHANLLQLLLYMV